jgi:hypothetical protein
MASGVAHKVLTRYAEEYDCGVEAHTALEDLLADLLHWCDQNKVDFEECLSSAHGHHSAEVAEAKEV